MSMNVCWIEPSLQNHKSSGSQYKPNDLIEQKQEEELQSHKMYPYLNDTKWNYI